MVAKKRLMSQPFQSILFNFQSVTRIFTETKNNTSNDFFINDASVQLGFHFPYPKGRAGIHPFPSLGKNGWLVIFK
jgi:hypothetical protein